MKRRKVLITGGARRLGRAIAERFMIKNWDIAITYNNSLVGALELEHFADDYGTGFYSAQADFQEPEQIKSAFEEIFNNFGAPDVLVNSAGLFMERKSSLELDLQEWDRINNVNLKSVFYCSQIYVNSLSGEGRIINIASLGGTQIWPNRTPYIVSKHGVITLSSALAKEFAPKVSVNCVAPGAIDLPLDKADYANPVSIDKIPMKSYGTADDVFDAIYFFATTSKYITGQTLSVDGGLGI